MERRRKATNENTFRGDRVEAPAPTPEPPVVHRPERTPHVDDTTIDMSHWDPTNLPELTVYPENTEARLRIMSASKEVDKNGNAYARVMFDVPGDEMFKAFTQNINLPTRERQLHDPKTYVTIAQIFRNFVTCFKIDVYGTMEPHREWPGCEGEVILGIDATNEEQFGRRNKIKRFMS